MPFRRIRSALMSSVSVIVVTFEGREYADALLRSLERQSRPPAEIIVVDNASSDGTADHIAERFPSVTLLRSNTNRGFAGGCNLGYARARGELIALINQDTQVDPLWIEQLVSVMESDEIIGAVVPKILVRDGPLIDCIGAEFDDIGFCWSRGHGQSDEGQFDEPVDVAALTGCSVLLRSSAIQGVRLFDESLFMYYEELELTLRIRAAGYRIVSAPAAVVRHEVSASVRASSIDPLLFKQFHGNRNRLKIVAKYFPLAVILRSLPLIVLSLVYWDVRFLLRGGPRWFVRAVAGQFRFMVAGVVERIRGQGVPAAAWMPWMQRHGLRDLLAVKKESGL